MSESSSQKRLTRVLLELLPLLRYLETEVGIREVSVELKDGTALVSWDGNLKEFSKLRDEVFERRAPDQILPRGRPTSTISERTVFPSGPER